MRVLLLNHRLINEVFFEDGSLSIERTGLARYRVTIESVVGPLALELWTTKRGRLRFDAADWHPAQGALEWDADGALRSFRVARASIHIENLTRDSYSFRIGGEFDISGRAVGFGFLRLEFARAAPRQASIHVEQAPSNEAFVEALGRPLLRGQTVVRSFREIAADPQTSEGLSVMRTDRAGEFRASFDFRSTEQELALALRLARRLGCRCLVSDLDPNPYQWVLVSPEGDLERVGVDSAALDRDELRLTTHLEPNNPGRDAD